MKVRQVNCWQHLLSESKDSMLIAVCGDSGNDSNTSLPPPQPEPAETHVRVFHASADPPMVNLCVDEEETVSEIDYLDSSGV